MATEGLRSTACGDEGCVCFRAVYGDGILNVLRGIVATGAAFVCFAAFQRQGALRLRAFHSDEGLRLFCTRHLPLSEQKNCGNILRGIPWRRKNCVYFAATGDAKGCEYFFRAVYHGEPRSCRMFTRHSMATEELRLLRCCIHGDEEFRGNGFFLRHSATKELRLFGIFAANEELLNVYGIPGDGAFVLH
jgi:hypothetical protein